MLSSLSVSVSLLPAAPSPPAAPAGRAAAPAPAAGRADDRGGCDEGVVGVGGGAGVVLVAAVVFKDLYTAYTLFLLRPI